MLALNTFMDLSHLHYPGRYLKNHELGLGFWSTIYYVILLIKPIISWSLVLSTLQT